jgi:hypothetical protein
MIYLYDYFLTKKNISEKDLEDSVNLFQLASSNKTSLLHQYKDKIDEYIKENKIDISILNKHKNRPNNILKNLSFYYNNIFIKENNIYLYFTYLVNYKALIEKNNLNIDSFNNVNNIYNKPFLIKYDNEAVFFNPYNDYSFYTNISINTTNITKEFSNIKNYFKLNKNINKNDIVNKFKKTIDILTQGSIINVTLPSIGIIKNYFTNENDVSYVSFIKKLVKIKNSDENISDYIPLKYINLGEIISNLLFSNINLNNNLNSESKKKIFINVINNFTVDLDEIYYDNTKSINKKLRKVKKEFIIPYKFDTVKNEILEYTSNDVDRIRNVKELIEKNNMIVEHVLKNIFEKKNNNIKVLDNKNYKNILMCYFFYIINLTYSICKLYLDKIDNFLIEIISSDDKRHGKLNIKTTFEFTSLLKKSLYQFKLLLLNNFYNLFIPSKISSGNYGMKINEFGCYIPESFILIQNDKFMQNFPFYGTTNIEINDIRLERFILKSENVYDIYDTKIKLEIGGYSDDFFIMKKSINLLEDYYKTLKNNNTFNIFIIDLLIENFKNKKIPIESLENIKHIMNDTRSNKAVFERKVLLNYDINLDKAYEYALNTIQLRNKMKETKKMNITNLLNTETIYLCTYNMYYLKSLGVINIVNNMSLEMDFKNVLLEKMIERKNDYEMKLSRNL